MSLENHFFTFLVILSCRTVIDAAVSEVVQEDTNYWNTTLISRTESTTTAVAIHQPVSKNRTRISYRTDDKKFDDLKKSFFSFRKPSTDEHFATFAGGYYINSQAILTVAKPFFEVQTTLLCFKAIKRKAEEEDVFVVHLADDAEGRQDAERYAQYRKPEKLIHHEQFKYYQMDKYNYAIAILQHRLNREPKYITPRKTTKYYKPGAATCVTLSYVGGKKLKVIQVELTSCGQPPEGIEIDNIICTEKTAENTVDAERDFGNPLICGKVEDEKLTETNILGIAIAGDGTANVYLKLEPELDWIRKTMQDATTIFVDAILREPTKLTMYFFALVFFYQLLN